MCNCDTSSRKNMQIWSDHVYTRRTVVPDDWESHKFAAPAQRYLVTLWNTVQLDLVVFLHGVLPRNTFLPHCCYFHLHLRSDSTFSVHQFPVSHCCTLPHPQVWDHTSTHCVLMEGAMLNNCQHWQLRSLAQSTTQHTAYLHKMKIIADRVVLKKTCFCVFSYKLRCLYLCSENLVYIYGSRDK